jgi:LPXTG-motif cell wall-anchored protein
VRKFVGVAVMALVAVLALPALAGAQTDGSTGSDGVPPPPPAGGCVLLSADPAILPTPFPASLQFTITGRADPSDNSHVQLFVNGAPAVAKPGDVVETFVTTPLPPTGPNFTLTYTATPSDVHTAPDGTTFIDFSISWTYGNQNAYNAACPTPGGQEVIRVQAEAASATTNRPGAAALAFTGSSDTPSYVLIGIAAIVVGAVLVVAARRRKQVS